MNSGTAEPTFNLLSIGQRGVGKTVFLVGSYTELRTDSQTKYKQKLWFDCQSRQVQEKIDRIVNYILQNGHYPPPTTNITNFNFTLKRRRLLGTQTLCHFHWSDIPGEICSIHNSDFRAMVTNSDGCCVFIDAYALVRNNNTYLQCLEEIIKQVMAIASLAYLHDLKYPFVVILTKCDLLEPSRLSHQLNQFLEPLTARLDAVKANYQTFYSLIPIVCTLDAVILKPTGAAAPLLWLTLELSQSYNLGLMQNRLEVVPHPRPNILQTFQELVSKLLRSRVRAADQAVEVNQKQIPSQYLLPTAGNRTHTRNSFFVLVSIVALVGIGGLAYRYTKINQMCSGLIKCSPAAKSPVENIRQTTSPAASFKLPSNSRPQDSTK